MDPKKLLVIKSILYSLKNYSLDEIKENKGNYFGDYFTDKDRIGELITELRKEMGNGT